MKFLLRYTVLPISLAVTTAGCNSDVFIDEFLPESSSVVVERSEAVSKIRFKAANWDIWSVAGSAQSDMGLMTLYGDIYDLNGNIVSHNQPLGGEGLLKMVYNDGLVDFRIERNDYRGLDVLFSENLYDRPYGVQIYVGNDYESGTVEVTFNPSEKYRIDSVVYRWNEFVFWNNSVEEKDAFTVDNTASPKPTSVIVSPFQHAKRTIRIWPDDYFNDCREQIFGVPLPEIAIPDVENSVPVDKGSSARFVQDDQRLPLPFPDDEKVEVVVKPYERLRIEVSLVLEQFHVPYTVYATGPAGRQRTFSGTLYSTLPYKYYILKSHPDK